MDLPSSDLKRPRLDTAALYDLVATMVATGADLHALRDPTRGGVVPSLNETARTAGIGIELIDSDLPIPQAVRDACGRLGLDPLLVASEGKLLAFTPAAEADSVLAAMRELAHGLQARLIGRCVADHGGMVVARTALGARLVIDMAIGEQLPRIC